MGKEFFKKTADLLQAKQKKKQWQKIVISLSLVVAMITSGLLIHPAITMERKAICGQEEHTHSAECYEKKLVCDKEEHTASEVEEAAAKEETIEEHKHSDSCYKEELTCDKKEHKHSEDCYEKETEAKEETSQAKSSEETKTTEAPKAEEPTEASKEEKKTEETTEAEKQEEKAEARTLTAKGEDYTVQVDCPAEAKIPENAELKVREIVKDKESDKEEYEAYYKKAQEALKEKEGEETDISTVRFFDITFMVDGKEIEPAAKVEVKITYDKKVEVSDKGEVKSVHFGDEKTEILDTKTNKENGKMDEVKFDADSFSVYGIVGTETLTGDVLTADGKTYTVTVTYGADAKIPEGATLEAREVTGDDAAYYAEKAADKLGSENAASRFFEIHILDKDGNKVQPKTAVKIKITYDDPIQLEDGQEIKQVHFVDSDSDSSSVSVDSVLSTQSVRRALKAPAAVTATTTSDNIEVLDVTTEGGNEVQSVEFEQSSFSVTGTVVTDLATEWPDDGYYAVIVKSGNNYYAVGLDGSLTSVTYDADKKTVTFNEISDSSTLSSYKWEFVTDGDNNDANHYLRAVSNQSTSYYTSYVYIDPYDSADGVSTSQHSLSKDSSGHLFYRKDSDWTKYYLAINRNGTFLSRVTSPQSAVQVFFANGFIAAGTDTPGHEGGDDTPTVDLGAPATNKSVTANNNGTYDISLSVTGKSQAQQSRSTADVVIIFDRSGSMRFSGTSSTVGSYGSGRRDYEAIKATKTLADTLLQNNTDDYPDTVRIGIVEFNNSASSALALTNNKTNIDKKLNYNETNVDNVPLAGVYSTGTNWEAALQQASTMLNGGRTDAAKYVIFVSDGNPTYYVNGGTGYETVSNIRNSYEAAKDDAKSLVDNGASFYTLGVYGNASRMSNLTAYAYTGSDIGTYPAGHYQTATDTASLTAAFQNIINEINRNFAFTDVTLTDGITSLTSKAKIQGNAGNFTYSGTDADGHTVTVPDLVKTARYDSTTGSVIWDLGDDYELPNGVTFTVSFTVWPTQQAYDILAALQNGTITYNDSTATVNGQTVDWTYFVQNSDGTYSYRTNTSQTVTYKQVTKDSNGNVTNTSEEKTSRISSEPENPDMDLTNHQVTVKKVWNDSLDSHNRQAITLKIGYDEDNDNSIVKTVDGETVYDSNVITVNLDGTSDAQAVATGTTVTTENGNTVWAKTISVAPGLIVNSETLEAGHQYMVVETGSSYNYELTAPNVHPMLIDSATVVYDSSKPNEAVITATNNLRGGVNIQKKVVANDGTTDISNDVADTFNVIIHISKDGTAYKYTDYGITDKTAPDDESVAKKNAYPIWYTKYVFASASDVNPNDVSAATSHSSDIVEDGETLTIKTNELIRLINVPIGSTYSVTETNIPNGYEQQSITDGGTVTANSSNTVTVTNKQKLASITVKKTDESNPANYLDGVTFILTKASSSTIDENTTWSAVSITDVTGSDGSFSIADGNASAGKTISSLPVGIYKLTETVAPAGYIMRTADTYFTVAINATTGKAKITLIKGNANAINSYASVDTSSTDTLIIANEAGQALPNTGGSGTLPYTLGGLMLMSTAAMMYGFIMRRRGRRLN